MKLSKAVIGVCAAFILSSCSSTGVIPMSQDSYMIGKKDHTPGAGVSLSNKADVLREANEFCRARNQDVQILQIDVIPAAFGRHGSTEMQFKCVAPGGTATAPVPKDANSVIEVRHR